MRQVVSGLFLLGLVGLYLLSFLAPYEVVGDVAPARASLGPGAAHWLGTDHLGRDVFWRLVMGSRAFVVPGLGAALLAGLGGAVIGAVAGWWDGWPARALRQGLNIIAAIPSFILILLVCAIYASTSAPPAWLPVDPPHLWIITLCCALVGVPPLAEALYARLQELQRAEFVLALRAYGFHPAWILLYHLLWVNGRQLVARHMLQTFGQVVVVETTLSYLGGFGVPEPTPSWGNMIAFELNIPDGNPWAWLAPALALCVGIAAIHAGSAAHEERSP